MSVRLIFLMYENVPCQGSDIFCSCFNVYLVTLNDLYLKRIKKVLWSGAYQTFCKLNVGENSSSLFKLSKTVPCQGAKKTRLFDDCPRFVLNTSNKFPAREPSKMLNNTLFMIFLYLYLKGQRACQ